MATDGRRAESRVTPAEYWVTVSSAAVAAGSPVDLSKLGDGECRALLCGAAGRVQGTMRNGSTFNLPFQAGQLIPGYFSTITQSTASDIQGAY